MFEKSNQPRVDPMSRVMRYRDFWSYEISIKGMRASKDESTAFQKEGVRLSTPEIRVKPTDNAKHFCFFQPSPTNSWKANIAHKPNTHNKSSNPISFKADLRIRFAPSSISAPTS
jgi:hypothetical protein